jgi:hypothetical protein
MLSLKSKVPFLGYDAPRYTRFGMPPPLEATFCDFKIAKLTKSEAISPSAPRSRAVIFELVPDMSSNARTKSA